MRKDINKLKFSIKTNEHFNGYGKYRANSLLPYGYMAKWRNKSGIYYIKNKITGLIYIGCSRNIGERISKHFSCLNVGNHPNHKLLDDYNKYKIDSFDYGVFEFTDENLLEKERNYQMQYGIDNLYNLQIRGEYRSKAQQIASKNTSKDTHKTIEYRQKMRNLKVNKIGQFDKITYRLIKIYNCKEDVCNEFNIAPSTLMGCCNGSKKSAKGYIWRYIDDCGNIIAEGKGRKRTIIVQNEDIV